VFNSRIAPFFCRWRKLHACCKARQSTLSMVSTVVLQSAQVVSILAALAYESSLACMQLCAIFCINMARSGLTDVMW